MGHVAGFAIAQRSFIPTGPEEVQRNYLVPAEFLQETYA